MGPFPHIESPIPKIPTLMTEVEVDLIVIQVLVSHCRMVVTLLQE